MQFEPQRISARRSVRPSDRGSVHRASVLSYTLIMDETNTTGRRPIAVFFHAAISGPGSNNNYEHRWETKVDSVVAAEQMKEQLKLIQTSGLAENSDKIVIGLNGVAEDADFASRLLTGGMELAWHGEDGESLIPTWLLADKWAREHPGWNICMHHLKGVLHPGNELILAWRRCMEKSVIHHWKRCVAV